jgi:hypothetical protein
MALWGFSRESTQSAAGANTLAGRAAGYQAPFVAGDSTEMAEKRNVIATSVGWVRRHIHTNTHSTVRIKDQVIVAANPGYGFDNSSNTYLGKPDIVQMYVKLNANGYITANLSSNLYIVFNTPMKFKAGGNTISITISNTASGNAAVARATVAATTVDNANNTLVIPMPALQGKIAGSTAGTYKIDAQTLSVTGNPLYNPEMGIVYSANLVVTGAVSNNLLNFAGSRITSFSVRHKNNQ